MEKKGQKIAVEIETGKSDWKRNIQKNLENAYQGIFLLPTNPKAYEKIQAYIQRIHLKIPIKVKQVQDFVR